MNRIILLGFFCLISAYLSIANDNIIEQIPGDVKQEIASHLDFDNMYNLSKTSKNMQKSMGFIWKIKFEDYFGELIGEDEKIYFEDNWKNTFVTLIKTLDENIKYVKENKKLKGVGIRDNFLRRANLEKLDLSEVDLSGVDLTKANLAEACLIDAFLTGANLTRANLSEANLWYANLNKANLTNAKLINTTFMTTNLVQANLTGADLSEVNFIETDLTGANLTGVKLLGTTMDSDTKLDDAYYLENSKKIPVTKEWLRERGVKFSA